MSRIRCGYISYLAGRSRLPLNKTLLGTKSELAHDVHQELYRGLRKPDPLCPSTRDECQSSVADVLRVELFDKHLVALHGQYLVMVGL